MANKNAKTSYLSVILSEALSIAKVQRRISIERSEILRGVYPEPDPSVTEFILSHTRFFPFPFPFTSFRVRVGVRMTVLDVLVIEIWGLNLFGICDFEFAISPSGVLTGVVQ
jgi:hypothetical protein